MVKRYPLETLETLKRRAQQAKANELLHHKRELANRERELEVAQEILMEARKAAEELRAHEQAHLASGELRIRDIALAEAFEATQSRIEAELKGRAEAVASEVGSAEAQVQRAERALRRSGVELLSVEAHRERWRAQVEARAESVSEDDALDVANNLRANRGGSNA
ncbi:MAG: hypothetical protein SFV15_17940 [Polyangiaceae bacterium]|nr:hypothetical protein [Polyangiaceae bacterium]